VKSLAKTAGLVEDRGRELAVKLSKTGIAGVWIRRRKGGRERYGWTVVYKGQTYRRTAKRNTLQGAIAEREAALGRLERGLPVEEAPEAPVYTVKQAAADYLKACENMRSYRRYKNFRDNLEEYFGDLPVPTLSQVTLAGYRKARAEAEAAGATINRELAFLRASLNHAVGEGSIREHYFSRLSRADRRKVFVEEPRTAGLRRVSDAEFAEVERRLPELYRPVARLLLATAMRKGEAVGLKWGEVRGDAILLTRTKSGKPRWVPLTKETTALLPKRPKTASDDDLVFVLPGGGSVGDNFNRVWKAARTGAKLPWLRIHDLRHEGASRFVEAGGTAREVQVLGGWSSLDLVERYTKADRNRIRQTLEKVGVGGNECAVSAPSEFSAEKRREK
jgi:integrase